MKDHKKAEETRLREKELELARLHVGGNSDNERTGEGCDSLDALVKSVRTLMTKVPNRPEETWLIKQDQSGINLSDPSGNLKSLNIFQDDKGVLRVGGRWEKAFIL
ncbi:hypothetical protein TNIN_222941 [Trichonephila inaurata madagascariensis]|uniref:Uncharacterized protein n=1 Tax=Trichonephila inaurata madagascariensis TaxID=2747483 RepID=A0A8X6X1Z5_9ARAC|nr:hypothetical protein TNIN_222941 [Trichonephila inaurata madagascariensis]